LYVRMKRQQGNEAIGKEECIIIHWSLFICILQHKSATQQAML
jgi:hypothetical protein